MFRKIGYIKTSSFPVENEKCGITFRPSIFAMHHMFAKLAADGWWFNFHFLSAPVQVPFLLINQPLFLLHLSTPWRNHQPFLKKKSVDEMLTMLALFNHQVLQSDPFEVAKRPFLGLSRVFCDLELVVEPGIDLLSQWCVAFFLMGHPLRKSRGFLSKEV